MSGRLDQDTPDAGRSRGLRRHRALTAIEFDRDLIEPLGKAAEGRGELRVIAADVLAAIAEASKLADEVWLWSTERGGRWVCLIGEVPSDRLITIAQQLQF